VGGTLGVVILAALAFLFFRRRRQGPAQATPPPYFNDMSAYAPGQIASSGTDRTSFTATPAPVFMPSNTQQFSRRQLVTTPQQTNPFDPSPASVVHTPQWPEYSPESHSYPLGTSNRPLPNAPPSSLPAGPLSHLLSTRTENPPPIYVHLEK